VNEKRHRKKKKKEYQNLPEKKTIKKSTDSFSSSQLCKKTNGNSIVLGLFDDRILLSSAV